MSEAYQAALAALQAGLSTIPPREGSKAPIAEWRQYQETLPTKAELAKWYSNSRKRIGLVCGAVSGGLECLDFDTHDIWGQYKQAAKDAELLPLLSKVASSYGEKTPNGFHLLYRCSAIESNTKLAQRASDKKTLIETRGEGGFIITAPSTSAGGDYILQTGGFESIATITQAERNQLHSLARTFDEIPKHNPEQRTHGNGDRVGDEFNRQHTWPEILESAGWQRVFERSAWMIFSRVILLLNLSKTWLTIRKMGWHCCSHKRILNSDGLSSGESGIAGMVRCG